METNGDSFLSAQDHGLWRLVQHVLVTWHTLVMVKVQNKDVRQQLGGLITFFVPNDATFRDEIVAFLEREGARFSNEGFPEQPGHGAPAIPPTGLKIVTASYKGIMPFVEDGNAGEIVAEITKVTMQRLKIDQANRRREELRLAGPNPWWGVFPVASPDQPIAAFRREDAANDWSDSRAGRNFFVKPVPKVEAASKSS